VSRFCVTLAPDLVPGLYPQGVTFMPPVYESLFILRPSLADDDLQKTLEKVKSTVEKAGGTIERLENWGKKKLAYEIKGEKKGVYVQLQFKGNGTAVSEVERLFRLEDAVMKFLTIKLEAHLLNVPPPDSQPATAMVADRDE
jgi:small subunit ribosomal protein S6